MDVQAALTEWREACGLRDWAITAAVIGRPAFDHEFRDIEDAKNWTAATRICDADKAARIFICGDSTDQEQSLAHELAHVIIRPLDLAADDAISAIPAGPARDLARRIYDRALEQAADHVARALIGTRDLAHQTREEAPA